MRTGFCLQSVLQVYTHKLQIGFLAGLRPAMLEQVSVMRLPIVGFACRLLRAQSAFGAPILGERRLNHVLSCVLEQ